MISTIKRLNLISTLTLLSVHIVGLFGTVAYLIATGFDIGWQEIFVFFFMYALGSIGINVGYHRCFSHRSFKGSKLLKWIILAAGSSAMEGSALAWCSDHRRHHKFQDTDADPYNINKGFWWAHMGWMLFLPTTRDFSNSPDLTRDPVIRNQNDFYPIWLIVWGALLPLGIGFIIGRPFECLLIGGFFRLFVLNQATYLINSYAHYFGRRPYSTELTARDSLICALLANGEGWHNFHHRFPFDYRNGHRFYHYDPAKWFIFAAQYLGLASELKRTPANEIFRARIQTKKESVVSSCPNFHGLTETLENALRRWDALQVEWVQKREELRAKKDESLRELQRELKMARDEFRRIYAAWLRSHRELLTTAS